MTAVELYWIPLGAGQRVVRASGRLYEALCASWQRRPRRDLYHSALVVTTEGCRYTIEMAPVPRHCVAGRGVVAVGAVGSRWLGSMRTFRYEVRRWRDGIIPDLPFAVDSPVLISDDPDVAERVLHAVGQVPSPVWGRDELGTGEMWNSNSVVSWTLASAGVLDAAGDPPRGGRALGWDAGVRLTSLYGRVSGNRVTGPAPTELGRARQR